MNLPYVDDVRVDERKVRDYLLAFDHPEGAGKAEFFRSCGFTAADWQVLAHALVTHVKTQAVSSTIQSKYGTKYCIDGPIECPDGRSPFIRSVWIIDTGERYPRLVTAHPL